VPDDVHADLPLCQSSDRRRRSQGPRPDAAVL